MAAGSPWRSDNGKRLGSTKRYAALFLAAAATIGGTVSVDMLVKHQEKEARQLALSPATPSAACIETLRARFETAAVLSEIPRGEGAPVIVIPGFMTGKTYMTALSARLKTHGYTVHNWGGGFNTGVSEKQVAALEETLQKVFEESGGQKVSLVGYSLGGAYARELARKHPEKIKNVVTISAPAQDIARLRQLSGLFHGTENAPSPEENLAVPLSALVSASDMAVGWRDALRETDGLTENIVIRGSHITQPFRADVARTVLDRLAQTPENRQPAAAFCAEKPPRVGTAPPVRP
ncbi:MAG: alpha/beta fold hydrolase [Micavibrio sp.]|nr:MAG: alpha/beta fold hydrolase [Micavibrio sp.]